MTYQTRIGNYGSYRVLNILTNPSKTVKARMTNSLIRSGSTVPKCEIIQDNKRFTIIATQGSEYIVKMPEGTYGRVDIRSERFLGAY